jgi:hypothetical protein
MDETNRIKFALYLDGWSYGSSEKSILRTKAIEVTPTEYTSTMKGHIFCPECCVGLFRSPEDKEYDRKGRKAFYAHSRAHTPECSLRVKKAEGKRFENEEQAKEAIENGELVIVKEFLKERPACPEIDGPLEYQGDPIEDQNGALSLVAIGRHGGDEFKLPGRITSIRGLCRNFEKNLYRYFHLPGSRSAYTLRDLLTNIESVTEPCDVPKLYFGKITHSWNCGKTPQNIRQTMLRHPRKPEYKDFCLKATDKDSQEHGIGDDSNGKVVIVFGKVTESGVGLCIERFGWGEFAVLPDKYVHLLY